MKTGNLMDRTYRVAAVLLLVLLCAACSPKLVRGESPMVRISELSHQDGDVGLQLSIRNVNDEALDILQVDLELSTEDQAMLVYGRPASININANGTETWTIDSAESDTTRQRLDALQSGEIKSLPYKLEGTIDTRESGRLRFEYEGHLYPLPGRPGHFR
jgi:hypothetical protein